MALRLLEIVVAQDDGDHLKELLVEVGALDTWTAPMEGGHYLARVLIATENTEGALNALDERFGEEEGFRATMVQIEGVLPKIEKDEIEQSQRQGPAVFQRISREELYQDVSSGADLGRIYLATVVLSTVIATIGLIKNDVAVIIGAMVIAPLLGPNIAICLGATIGDMELLRRGVKALAVGVGLGIGLALLAGLLLPFDPQVEQIVSRTRVSFYDVGLALAAGAAGALAYTTGVPAALVGVMVAVALLPPLAATGLLAGAGLWLGAVNALVLVLTNLTCISIAGVSTFLLQKVRPRNWLEEQDADRATRLMMITLGVLLLLLLAVIYFFWQDKPSWLPFQDLTVNMDRLESG